MAFWAKNVATGFKKSPKQRNQSSNLVTLTESWIRIICDTKTLGATLYTRNVVSRSLSLCVKPFSFSLSLPHTNSVFLGWPASALNFCSRRERDQISLSFSHSISLSFTFSLSQDNSISLSLFLQLHSFSQSLSVTFYTNLSIFLSLYEILSIYLSLLFWHNISHLLSPFLYLTTLQSLSHTRSEKKHKRLQLTIDKLNVLMGIEKRLNH